MNVSTTAYRSDLAGEMRGADAGRETRLAGWVHRRRDLGGLIFVDLRDRTGRVQLSFGPDWSPADVLERARRLGQEWVIAVRGEVVPRPEGNVNPELSTGEIEVHVSALDVLAAADTPPIPVALGAGDELPAEELRLRYRYLDLRRDALQQAIHVRHRCLQLARRTMTEMGFWEVDTPMLTRRTPEGARDYLVPSRVHPGEFYALPQSPQLYKQLLMVSGYDRYFQIARCLRDEDLRADRQPEFTQIDAELSFVDEEDIFGVGEALVSAIWREILSVELESPFPRLTHADAMARYGTDKPDLRFGMDIQDLTALLRDADFRLFRDTAGSGESIRGIVAPGGASLSRKDLDALAPMAQKAGAAGALWVRRTGEGLAGQFAKGLDEGLTSKFIEATGLGIGDLFVAVIGHFSGSGRLPSGPGGPDAALDVLRRHLAGKLAVERRTHAWLWVTDFPMFEWNAEDRSIGPAHHPFTMPHAEDVPRLVEATAGPLAAGAAAEALFRAGIRSRAYDAVYNGMELASGSIRIHDPVLQRHVFRAVGIAEEEAERKFGFLLEAFRHGAPPHGGFAFGFDRMVMALVGAASMRDVIAFPKTTAARALFEGAPSPVSPRDLEELNIVTVDAEGV
jgi:aspartyl-tRNA synthetase